MILAGMLQIRQSCSISALIGVMFITFALSRVQAAELVMFEQAGCAWCAAFDRDVAPIYARTEEGLVAPLRRVDIDQKLPPDLAFIGVERLTPLFVLIDKDHEIGRIRGYPGPESFWMQIAVLFDRLHKIEASHQQRAQLVEKILLAKD